MTRPTAIVRRPSLPNTLRTQRRRVDAVESPFPGQWVYVLPIAPATQPLDAVPGDPLAPTFQSGCSNVAGNQAVSFRIHPATRLALRGSVDLHGASLPVLVFTLPARFRPLTVHPVVFPSTDGVHLYSGRVDPNGDIWLLTEFA